MPAITHSLAATGTPHLPSPQLLPPEIFHNLGQYSPWFPVNPSSPQDKIPDHCEVTFVSQLERHGSRYPTGGAYKELRKTLRQIAKHLQHVSDSNKHDKQNQGLHPQLQWLRKWVETKKTEDGGLRNRLGNSELTPYGQYEAFASGWRFYERYSHLFDGKEQVDVNADYDTKLSSNSLIDLVCSLSKPASMPALTLFSHLRTRICQYLTPDYVPHKHSEHPKGRPFVRSSGADRVITSSRFFLQGFSHSPFHHASPESAPWPPKNRPSTFKSHKPHRHIPSLSHPDVIIPEVRKNDKLGQIASNNTLDVYTCPTFERDFRDNAQSPASLKTAAFAHNATAHVRERLASKLGVRKGGSKDRRGERIHIEPKQVLQLFGLCAFDTVARLNPYGLLLEDKERNEGVVSPFCGLFEEEEFAQIYEVSTNMEKDYGFAGHNPLHKALATPWLRELLARLEGRKPVMDPPTSINTTLDRNEEKFPLPKGEGPNAFVDFTHDNQLAPVIAALGLWDENHEWSTAKTTPFSGRLTVEKLRCGEDDDFVRVLVNDQPAHVYSGGWCGDGKAPAGDVSDSVCPIHSFLKPLEWVDQAEEWDKCYSKGHKKEKEDV
ncbi:related to 3-phytase A precursor [Ustilago bromivora]|uniref:Related to 3-phytase A n=1 Tax=Ustilago bromivora TaxID=307758 RepID=A0A1K0G6C3_9BASI|nr:related to 3-phytase A precursor [Ustilago bromivora]